MSNNGTSNTIIPFTNDDLDVTIRVIEMDDGGELASKQPWFVAADAMALLQFSRPDNMLRVLGESEKIVTPRSMRGKLHHRAKLISESGLYKLIMRSDKPQARPFQDWVTRTVLPAIYASLPFRMVGRPIGLACCLMFRP